MPNIVLVGYEGFEDGNGEFRNTKDHIIPSPTNKLVLGLHLILTQMGISREAVITAIPAVCASIEKIGQNKVESVFLSRSDPFIVVRDTDRDRGEKIAIRLNRELNEDVELEVIDRFLPKKK